MKRVVRDADQSVKQVKRAIRWVRWEGTGAEDRCEALQGGFPRCGGLVHYQAIDCTAYKVYKDDEYEERHGQDA